MNHRFRSPWSDLFAHLLERQGFNQSTFGDKVRKSQGVIQSYASGRVRPPRSLLDPWSDALDLAGEERRNFIFLGYLAWAPRQIQMEITENRRQLREAQKAIVEIREQLVQMNNEVDRMQKHMAKLRTTGRALRDKALKARLNLGSVDLEILDVELQSA